MIKNPLFRSVPDKYTDKLIEEGVLSQVEVDTITKGHHNYLQNEMNNLEKYVPEKSYFERQWKGMEKAKDQITTWDTGLDPSLLGFIGNSSLFYPEGFVSGALVDELGNYFKRSSSLPEHPPPPPENPRWSQDEEDPGRRH